MSEAKQAGSERGTMEWTSTRTLAECIETLGRDALLPACAPQGLDLRVGDLVVVGMGEPVPPAPDGVMLLVGGYPGQAQTVDAVQQAAASQYVAVVVKERGQDATELVEVAADAGIALLILPDDMPWRHLDALLTAALNSAPSNRTYEGLGIGDLFALANAVATSVGGAVTLEDPQGHILAYSNLPHQEIDERRKLAILGRQTPDRPQNADEYRKIMQSDRPVRFDFDNEDVASRLAVAVRAGNENVGVIFALDAAPELGQGAELALQEAGRIAALHLLRAQSHRDPERWARAEAFRSLLDGAISARVAAVQLAMDLDSSTAVLAVSNSDTEAVPGIANARIIDLVSLYCGAWHPNALCTGGGDVVYALLPTQDDVASGDRRRKFAEDVASTLERSMGLQVSVGIGPVTHRLDEVPTSRRLADRVLAVLTADDTTCRVATVGDVRSRVILGELAERKAGHLHLLPGPAQDIIDHDVNHGTVHGDTLLAFLEAFGDAAKAASKLSIHENTLRYRIRRIRELFNVSLDDPDERLLAWLRLRLDRA